MKCHYSEHVLVLLYIVCMCVWVRRPGSVLSNLLREVAMLVCLCGADICFMCIYVCIQFVQWHLRTFVQCRNECITYDNRICVDRFMADRSFAHYGDECEVLDYFFCIFSKSCVCELIGYLETLPFTYMYFFYLYIFRFIVLCLRHCWPMISFLISRDTNCGRYEQIIDIYR